jgi:hypothetical protein
VWDLGWNKGPWELIARVLPMPGFWAIARHFTGAGFLLTLQGPVIQQDWTNVSLTAIALPPTRFPYGWDVEPD